MDIPLIMKKRFGSYQYSALNVSVFVCGAVLMIFELVGSRMFAPFLGTSTYVWTSLIGVILGFLSLGYWYGGKLADKKTSFATYAKIIFCAAASILVVFFIQSGVLFFFKTYIQQIELSAVLSAIVLFAPASFLRRILFNSASRNCGKFITAFRRARSRTFALSTIQKKCDRYRRRDWFDCLVVHHSHLFSCGPFSKIPLYRCGFRIQSHTCFSE
ncbi:hypothetical protein A3E97_01135 [Candidatus Uhrbacteria bacterium RIFCSPHIGHO2_12_FULL_47_12]|nr:MAG: hypothetical protein A3E97_01135 [Candidatus Uhrbacteria bacterium RIFCSPHIGHO2_12_FULL_47_12]